ncbi:MAG TPA: signal peptide peptidase SppA [Dehalococcoidia bacterium]|nr:signal peptide peptidase SppA [Dehalococcoidia bacterium]
MPRWLWILLGAAVAFVLLVGTFGAGIGIGYLLRGGGGLGGGGQVALIRVEGAIQSGEGDDNPFAATTGAYSERITKQLRRAQQDFSIKAVVLRVDSPGGGVTPSDEIRNEILRTRNEHGKPVIVSMGSLAASGGYYVSAPANWVIANPTTLTGSIGVIMMIPELQGLLDKVGVRTYVFKSGEHKDDSSGLVPLTASDQAIFEGLIRDSYDRFVQVVAEGRGLPADRVRELADGRVYTGEQAKAAGLVDEFGDLPEAVAKAGELGGLRGKPTVVEYNDAVSLSALLSGYLRPPAANLTLDGVLGIDRTARLEYRYLPVP